MTRRGRGGYVYMLASKRDGTLYLGITSAIPARMEAHRTGRGSQFVKKYGVFTLVWYEYHALYSAAIQRETSIKRWKREWKIALIEKTNPYWDDLLLKWNA
jgi:putative endonuclease